MSSSNSSTPSLAALLGLVAVAGYQNRDKLGSLLSMVTGGGGAEKVEVEKTSGGGLMGSLTGALGSLMGGGGTTAAAGGLGGMAGALGGLLGGGNAAGGIGELVTKMTGNGMGEVVKSWVATGPNTPVSTSQLESVLGSDVLGNVIAQTGLSREELLSRLSAILPEAIDKMTPNGRLPS